jgi:PDZ domain
MLLASLADYDRYQARLCRLKIWPDFSGYGFNLHADRTKMGQFIGKVDAGSPAEESGLREGDRIMEVNGVSVVGKNHAEVVGLVKSRIGEVDMLVVDPETDEHYQSHNVTVHGAMPGVITITCPHNNPHAGKKLIFIYAENSGLIMQLFDACRDQYLTFTLCEMMLQ